MSEAHEIASLADAVKVVNAENLNRFLADLREWFEAYFIVAEEGQGKVTMAPVIYWKDDGIVGLSHMRVQVAGNSTSTKGSE
jgi:hypothetical protein